MARIARIVLPGRPHLVGQRGYENKQVFFSADDFESYKKFMADSCKRLNVKILAYCLMPNHVHMVAVPSTEDALARALGEAHRSFAKRLNQRYGRGGKLWHARFSSCALEKPWLAAAMRQAERDPVDSGMVSGVDDYPWTSVAANSLGQADPLINTPPPDVPGGWTDYISNPNSPQDTKALMGHEKTGRPLGTAEFIERLEKKLGRRIKPKKRGRKPKNKAKS